MARLRHLTLTQTAGWLVTGFAAGFVGGVVAGEWFGAVTSDRLSGRPTIRRGRGSAADAGERTRAALATDPALATLAVRPVSRQTVEITGWVENRLARTRASRLVAALPGIETVINSILVRGEDDQPQFPHLRLTDQSA